MSTTDEAKRRAQHRPAPESFECGCSFQPIAEEPLLSEGRASVLARWEKYPGDYTMRSCWNCNGSHEHLKKADGYPIRCFCCGHLYVDGARLSATEAEEKP